MLTALRLQNPSPEADLLASFFRRFGEVVVLDPWDVRSHVRKYDMAACVGPVTSCPLADKRLLFVLGQTHAHRDLEWDAVVVTSQRARMNALRMFGHGARVFVAQPPLLAMDAGKRRLMERRKIALHASCDPPGTGPGDDGSKMVRMAWWAFPKDTEIPFSPMEFNSLCRHGAYGFYNQDDGYDVVVRRHLVFGSPVVCNRRKDVLGDIVDLCIEDGRIPDKVEPLQDRVMESDYLLQLEEIIRRL